MNIISAKTYDIAIYTDDFALCYEITSAKLYDRPIYIKNFANGIS